MKVCTTCQNRYPEDFLVCPRDATPLHHEGREGDPLVGKVLGDAYQVLRVVGEGGKVARKRVCVQCIRSGKVQRPQKKKPFATISV